MTKAVLAALALLTLLVRTAAAKDMPCPFPGQKPVLLTRLFLGESALAGEGFAGRAWDGFLSMTVTPRFPGGFTVYDAHGQWQDLRTGVIGRENTRVLEIAAENTPAARRRIAEIARLYRGTFHQQSVGIVTSFGCGVF